MFYNEISAKLKTTNFYLLNCLKQSLFISARQFEILLYVFIFVMSANKR